MKKHLNITIEGGVQNVGFRYYSSIEAEKLDVKGLIKNLSDDKVYIEAEAEEENLAEFLAWCKVGPVKAEVKKVESSFAPLKNYTEFSII